MQNLNLDQNNKCHEGLGPERLSRVLKYIEDNIGKPLRLNDLAKVAALSHYHFARSFERSMHISPVRYIWSRRIDHARDMLRQTRTPAAVIAYDCGFSSQSHFNTLFKKLVGITPARFRNMATILLTAGVGIHLLFDAIEIIDYIDLI